MGEIIPVTYFRDSDVLVLSGLGIAEGSLFGYHLTMNTSNTIVSGTLEQYMLSG